MVLDEVRRNLMADLKFTRPSRRVIDLGMLLPLNTLAILVFGFIQVVLLGLGDVAVVLGFVDRLTLRDIFIMFLVTGGLPPGHGTVRKPLH
jgi:hypothetical protein